MIDLPLALHIPDGFLSAGVAAATGLAAIAAVAYGLRVANVDSPRPACRCGRAALHLRRPDVTSHRGRHERPLLGRTLRPGGGPMLRGPWLACLGRRCIAVQAAHLRTAAPRVGRTCHMGVWALLAGLLGGPCRVSAHTHGGRSAVGVVYGLPDGARPPRAWTRRLRTVPLARRCPVLGVHA